MPQTSTDAPPPYGDGIAADGRTVRLGDARPGDRGRIVEVRADTRSRDRGLPAAELERRLLEFGFVEGTRVELLHEGPIGADPIVVRVDDMRVALRRSDAHEVWVRLATAGR